MSNELELRKALLNRLILGRERVAKRWARLSGPLAPKRPEDHVCAWTALDVYGQNNWWKLEDGSIASAVIMEAAGVSRDEYRGYSRLYDKNDRLETTKDTVLGWYDFAIEKVRNEQFQLSCPHPNTEWGVDENGQLAEPAFDVCLECGARID